MRTFQKTSVFPALSVQDNVLIGLHRRASAGLASILVGRRTVRAEEAALARGGRDDPGIRGARAAARAIAASSLPYGEQRLLELAVALAARPRLLLLDEPAAGMTGGETERLVELIRRVREQRRDGAPGRARHASW